MPFTNILHVPCFYRRNEVLFSHKVGCYCREAFRQFWSPVVFVNDVIFAFIIKCSLSCKVLSYVAEVKLIKFLSICRLILGFIRSETRGNYFPSRNHDRSLDGDTGLFIKLTENITRRSCDSISIITCLDHVQRAWRIG